MQRRLAAIASLRKKRTKAAGNGGKLTISLIARSEKIVLYNSPVLKAHKAIVLEKLAKTLYHRIHVKKYRNRKHFCRSDVIFCGQLVWKENLFYIDISLTDKKTF